jgi:hypothetical protein
MATIETTASRPSVIAYVFGGLALAVLLAMSILFIGTGLLAPLWAIIGFVAAWLVLFVLGCIWIRRHPWRVVLLPFIAAAILYGGLNAGEALLRWQP